MPTKKKASVRVPKRRVVAKPKSATSRNQNTRLGTLLFALLFSVILWLGATGRVDFNIAPAINSSAAYLTSGLSRLGDSFFELVNGQLAVVPSSVSVQTKSQPKEQTTIEKLEGSITAVLNSKGKTGLSAADLRALEQTVSLRGEELERLAQSNPWKFNEIVNSSNSKNIRDGLKGKGNMDKYLESQADMTGALIVSHADNFSNPSLSKYSFFIQAAGKTYNFSPLGPAPTGLSGAKVHVVGTKIGSYVVAPSDKTSMPIVQKAIDENAVGAQKTAIVLLRFQNSDANVPFPREEVYTRLTEPSSHFNKFFAEASGNRISFTGEISDIYGWWTVARSYQNAWANCFFTRNDYYVSPHFFPCSFEVADLLRANNVTLSNYDRVIFVVDNFQSVSEMSIVGYAFMGKVDLGSFLGGFNATAGHMGSVAWINARMPATYSDPNSFMKTAAHEVGHGLGVNEGFAWQCEKSDLDAGRYLDGSTCSLVPYMNLLSVMGYSTMGFHFEPAYKEAFGWLSGGGISSVGQSGDYTITNAEAAAGVRAVKIQRPGSPDSPLYVEWRRPVGYDAVLGNNSVAQGNQNGVLISTSDCDVSNYCYDSTGYGIRSRLFNVVTTTPRSFYQKNAFTQGQTFKDEGRGVTISAIKPNFAAGTMSFRVTMGTPLCVHASPYVEVGSLMSFSAGEEAQIPITIGSADSGMCTGGDNIVISNESPSGGWPSSVYFAGSLTGARPSSVMLYPGSFNSATGILSVQIPAKESYAYDGVRRYTYYVGVTDAGSGQKEIVPVQLVVRAKPRISSVTRLTTGEVLAGIKQDWRISADYPVSGEVLDYYVKWDDLTAGTYEQTFSRNFTQAGTYHALVKVTAHDSRVFDTYDLSVTVSSDTRRIESMTYSAMNSTVVNKPIVSDSRGKATVVISAKVLVDRCADNPVSLDFGDKTSKKFETCIAADPQGFRTYSTSREFDASSAPYQLVFWVGDTFLKMPMTIVDNRPASPATINYTVGGGTINLSWAAVPGVNLYYYWRTTDPNYKWSGSVQQTGYVTTAGLTDRGLKNGTYYYYVTSRSYDRGESVSATRVGPIRMNEAVPSAPVVGTPTVSGRTITLTWPKIALATKGYDIWRANNAATTWNKATPLGNIAGNSFTDRNLPNGDYYYFVFSKGAAGDSTFTKVGPVRIGVVSPVITNFAMPSSVYSGGYAFAYWTSTGTSYCTMSGAGFNSSIRYKPIEVTVNATTKFTKAGNYTLTCYSSSGEKVSQTRYVRYCSGWGRCY